MAKLGSRMRPALAFAAVFAASLLTRPPGAAAEAAKLPYDPPVGSRWTIVSEGNEEKFQDGKSTATTTSSRTEELTIIEKLPDGYRVASVLRDYDIRGEGGDVVAANALLGAVRNVVVRAAVDGRGKPVRIENFDEVVKAHQDGFEKMIGAYADKPQLAAKLREFLAPLMTAMKNPDEAAQWYLETAAQLSIAQDTGLAVGEERRSTKAAPNPFGGDLKTNVSLRLVEADPASGHAKLVQTRGYDAEALKEFAGAMAKKLASGATAAELDKVLKELSLSIDDHTEYVVEHGMTRSISEASTQTAKALGHVLMKRERNQVTVTPLP